MDGIWRKNSKCDTTNCVEMALIDGDVHVRDAQRRELELTAQAWAEFIAGVRDGEFDRPR